MDTLLLSPALRTDDRPPEPALTLNDTIDQLLQEHLRLWWASASSLPRFETSYTPREQAENEKQLDGLTSGLMQLLKSRPQAAELQARLRPGLLLFARTALHLDDAAIDFVESSGLTRATLDFARMARRFDPQISGEDIYQSGRNVMTAALIQLLLGLPVEVTPALFAYSMLYPYTDNYLDDPLVSPATKKAFNQRFQRRLQGESITAANRHEEIISELVGMIEGQWQRSRYPLVYESLLAIHAAQARSLRLVAPGASPYELDVLGISFEKGGTSVLADGYLAAGELTSSQQRYLFGYGAFTQLMDDLEDLEADRAEGRMTIFSQSAAGWKLDSLTHQLIHFGRNVFTDLDAFDTSAVPALRSLAARCLDPILLDLANQSSFAYSGETLREYERHMPFRFSAVRKQRERLGRQKIGLNQLVDLLLEHGGEIATL
jgi:hypothetical protein